MIQKSSPTKTRWGRNPLIIEGGQMTLSRAKRVKEAMGLLEQKQLMKHQSWREKRKVSCWGRRTKPIVLTCYKELKAGLKPNTMQQHSVKSHAVAWWSTETEGANFKWLVRSQ